MDLYAFPPIAALLDGAHALLMGLADLLEPLAGAASAAAAVVLVTLLVRAALIPVGISQAKAERTRARLAPPGSPTSAEARERPRTTPARDDGAVLRRGHLADSRAACRCSSRRRSSGSSTPCSSCRPSPGTRTTCSSTLFGVPLGSSLAGTIASGTLTRTLVVVRDRHRGDRAGRRADARAFRPQPVAGAASEPIDPAAPAAVLGSAGMLRAIGLLQFLTAVIAVFVPLAAALYLLVTVAWTLGQRMVLRRAYPPIAPPLPAVTAAPGDGASGVGELDEAAQDPLRLGDGCRGEPVADRAELAGGEVPVVPVHLRARHEVGGRHLGVELGGVHATTDPVHLHGASAPTTRAAPRRRAGARWPPCGRRAPRSVRGSTPTSGSARPVGRQRDLDG